ncbi:MAG: U32 family peptidase [Firmicutes bacterium]|nr:U32 family peptidase [Bacillota bacterium]
MEKPRILAPVSSLKMAELVLDNGADIIYAGIKGWSLRPDIFEVTREEMESIIDLAKNRKKQIFIAMNCFYQSRELPDAMELIKKYAKRGVSGVIVSEIGLIRAVRRELPDLPVHVSVQISASNSYEIEYYKSQGVKAVVLPRDMIDLSLENIRAMAGKGLELEVFAVGDDTSNYDGRCQLSAYLFQQVVPDNGTGRKDMIIGNANRCGYCFLACKRKCRIGDKTGYLLKRGDLNIYNMVPDLVEAGVSIFKIQGREFPIKLVGKLMRTFRGLLDNRNNPLKFKAYVRTMDDLIGLKQVISANHLWLLAKSNSPFWKKIRRQIEEPWDNLTSFFWLNIPGMKHILKKIAGITG